jgi:hypothetical protein
MRTRQKTPSLNTALRYLGVGLVALMTACGDDALAPAGLPLADQQGPLRSGITAGSCDLAGTWAMKFEIPVSWRFNLGITSGSGTIEQWALTERRMLNDHTIEETVRFCGSQIPTYQALPIYGGERYGVAFPDALFDEGFLPTLTGHTFVSESQPGAVFASDPLAISLGAELPHPKEDPWPRRTSDLTPYLVDSDQDGQPGVTVWARDDDGLVLPPVSTSKAHRAVKFHLALRNMVGAQGKIIDCDRFEGQAIVPKLGNKVALTSTIIGCELDNGAACSRAQATLANTFQPQYVVGENSRSTMVRVDANTTCAQVRARAY